MNLKIATLVAIVGQSIYLLVLLALNLRFLEWSRSMSMIVNVIGSGCLIFFFIVLFIKQQN